MYRQDNDKNKRIKILLHLLGKRFLKQKKKRTEMYITWFSYIRIPSSGARW